MRADTEDRLGVDKCYGNTTLNRTFISNKFINIRSLTTALFALPLAGSIATESSALNRSCCASPKWSTSRLCLLCGCINCTSRRFLLPLFASLFVWPKWEGTVSSDAHFGNVFNIWSVFELGRLHHYRWWISPQFDFLFPNTQDIKSRNSRKGFAFCQSNEVIRERLNVAITCRCFQLLWKINVLRLLIIFSSGYPMDIKLNTFRDNKNENYASNNVFLKINIFYRCDISFRLVAAHKLTWKQQHQNISTISGIEHFALFRVLIKL